MIVSQFCFPAYCPSLGYSREKTLLQTGLLYRSCLTGRQCQCLGCTWCRGLSRERGRAGLVTKAGIVACPLTPFTAREKDIYFNSTAASSPPPFQFPQLSFCHHPPFFDPVPPWASLCFLTIRCRYFLSLLNLCFPLFSLHEQLPKAEAFVNLVNGYCYSNKMILFFYWKGSMHLYFVTQVRRYEQILWKIIAYKFKFIFARKKPWCFILVPGSEKFRFALMMIKHTNEFRQLGLSCYIIAENYYLLKGQ